MPNKKIIIFKNLTTGFMNLKYINYLADVLSKNNGLRENLVFILDNSASNESNQAIMQMYNKLLGYNIFSVAYSNGEILEYRELNDLELRKKINGINIELNSFLKEKYKDYNTEIHIIENDIYENILSIIGEDVQWQY